MSEVDDLSTYLGEHAPFDGMSPRARTELAAAASAHTFRAGDLIVDYAAATPDEIWVVRTGTVALLTSPRADADQLDLIEAGGVFGYLPLLSEGRVSFTARATEPSTVLRLPGVLVRAVFAQPAGLSYLATSAWDVISTRSTSQQPSMTPVGDLVDSEPVFTEADTSVREAVRHMTDRQASYVLVRHSDGGLGIFTDRDLRTRVVAADADLQIPIGQVVSAPARTVTADRSAASALIDMLENGIRHLPVVDPGGRVVGVVEEHDLVASGTRQSFLVRRRIALATDRAELESAASRVTGLAVDLFRGGTDAAGTSAVLSVVIDAVVRRALDLELADQAGAWSTRFAWLSMGSVARREAVPSSDVDSALSWADDVGADADQMRHFAAAVHTTLDRCNLPTDTNGAVAFKPRFSRSAQQWAHAAAGWLDDPMADNGIVMSSLLLDARPVWGDAVLHTAPAAFARMTVDHPHALRLQLLNALAGKPRTRSLRDIVARRGGTFDLKSHALTPIVNLARWGGLTVGIVSASTTARLQAAAGNGLLSVDDATVLREVFDLLQRLRMAHQIDQLAAGVPPCDIITLSELSPLSRSLLNDGVREIAAVQRRVRSLATTTEGRGVRVDGAPS
ncbi:MAG: putative nucleotidyltransferase substrate binding domain-containing protein [Mycobacterium sp.]